MARTYVEIEIPAKKVRRIDSITCCFCGAHAVNRHDEANWDKRCPEYEYKIVTVKIVKGNNYPEGGTEQGIFWDICTKCFEEKVRPHLPDTYEKLRTDW